MEKVKIIETTPDNILEYGVCGYKNINRPGYPEKIEWFQDRFREGLKIRTLIAEDDGAQGMMETIPGEYCWRPVEAKGYMFIHCLFVGFKRVYKGKGYASMLLDECENDAKKGHMLGVAVVTRKGSFMVGNDIFIKRDYKIVDEAPSDFELLIKKFDDKASPPQFRGGWAERRKQYCKGLTIIRAFQCPYTVKNVNEICESAEKEYGIQPRVITLQSYTEAQESPCPFGIFCMIYDGEIIAEHPISKARFKNIMNKLNSR